MCCASVAGQGVVSAGVVSPATTLDLTAREYQAVVTEAVRACYSASPTGSVWVVTEPVVELP